MEKVYCGKCKHFNWVLGACEHIENCDHIDQWNYVKKENHQKHPSEINKTNDCKWFEEDKTP